MQSGCRQMTPSMYRLGSCKAYFHYAIWFELSFLNEGHITAQGNHGCHCFPQSLTSRKGGTTGINIETLHSERERAEKTDGATPEHKLMRSGVVSKSVPSSICVSRTRSASNKNCLLINTTRCFTFFNFLTILGSNWDSCGCFNSNTTGKHLVGAENVSICFVFFSCLNIIFFVLCIFGASCTDPTESEFWDLPFLVTALPTITLTAFLWFYLFIFFLFWSYLANTDLLSYFFVEPSFWKQA